MEERELTQLLQQLGDRVTPGPAPVRRIVDAGEALRGRRSGRVRMVAVAAAAAAVVGGGSLAATVLDFPSITTATQDSGGGNAETGGDAGGGEEMAPEAAPGSGGSDEGASAADAVAPAAVTPDVAGPGERVEIEVPGDVAFRAEWSLQRSVGGAWKPQFVLVDADFALESGVPLSRRADSPEALADVPGPKDGPVTLVVPDAATPGSYRLCQTVDDGTAWCGSLTVTG
jgi:hypothetical protein